MQANHRHRRRRRHERRGQSHRPGRRRSGFPASKDDRDVYAIGDAVGIVSPPFNFYPKAGRMHEGMFA